MGVRVRGDTAALEAAAFMAGELLRNGSFAPIRTLQGKPSYVYSLDFVEDSFRVRTNVFLSQVGREAMFSVDLGGRIRGDTFVVSDPATETALFSFTRNDAAKPDFFSREFPILAHDARRSSTATRNTKEIALGETIDLMLGIPIRSGIVTVRVEKAAESVSADVKNPISGELVMRLPLASLHNVANVVKTIEDYLAANSAARTALASSSIQVGGSSPPEDPKPQEILKNEKAVARGL